MTHTNYMRIPSLHRNQLRGNRGAVLFLLAFTLIAYWPISFHLFSVKNDAIHYFLPVRYMVSSSIEHGYFPYWANSFYLGYPIHGDMQSGVWNPFVQVISVFTTYNVTVYHIESLLYIFLGGLAFYKLAGLVTSSPLARVAVSCAYILCGYMPGSAQFINWLAAGAFIPFTFYYYISFLRKPSVISALKTAISCWLLFVCAYPADSIVTAYGMLLAAVLYFIRHWKQLSAKKKVWINYGVLHLLLIAATLLLCSPALYSFMELLPYYKRGDAITFQVAAENSFAFKNALSFIAPGSVTAPDYISSTDPTGRNIFIGIYTLGFAFTSFFQKPSYRTVLLQAVAIAGFLFCLGDATPVRQWCFDLLPGMDTFRHPSHFRVITIIALLLLAAIVAEQLQANQAQARKIIQLLFIGGAGLLLITCCVLLIKGNSQLLNFFTALGGKEQLKHYLQGLGWKDILLASCILQLGFIAAYLFIIRRKTNALPPLRSFLALHCLNLFINGLLVFPAILVSQYSPSALNRIIDQQAGYYDPTAWNQTIAENSRNAGDHFSEIGLGFFYSQQPGLTKVTNSPAFLSSMDHFVQSGSLYKYISGKPAAWLSNQQLSATDTTRLNDSTGCVYSFTDSVARIASCQNPPGIATITAIDPGRFTIRIIDAADADLNLVQAYHHNWKATVNGKKADVRKGNLAFLQVHVSDGNSEVKFAYTDNRARLLLVISLASLFIIIVCMLFSYSRSRRASTANADSATQ